MTSDLSSFTGSLLAWIVRSGSVNDMTLRACGAGTLLTTADTMRDAPWLTAPGPIGWLGSAIYHIAPPRAQAVAVPLSAAAVLVVGGGGLVSHFTGSGRLQTSWPVCPGQHVTGNVAAASAATLRSSQQPVASANARCSPPRWHRAGARIRVRSTSLGSQIDGRHPAWGG